MPVLNESQQDFNLIPFLNSVAEPIAGSVTPSASNVGRFYRNTSTNRLEIVISSTTVVSIPNSGTIVDADIASGAAIALSKLATNPLARANHTGTQTASTISDFDTQVNTHKPTDLALMTSAFNFNGQQAKQMSDPTAATDGVTLQYLQAAITAAVNGRDWKDNVRVSTGNKSSAGNISISSAPASIDGVTLNSGDRVLLAAQSDGTQNGIYVYNGSGSAMTRSPDADNNPAGEVTEGMTVPITEGSNVDQFAMLTTVGAITLGTTALNFMFVGAGSTYAQGTGITITGNVIALAVPVTVANGGTGGTTAAAARNNLNAPQKGVSLNVPALTAGSETQIAHGLNTLGVTLQAYRTNDGASVNIALRRVDANTVGITADVAVSANALVVVVNPIV